MIEIVILFILSKYDTTIYRAGKIIDELFFGYLKSSTGTINPALKRLEKMGCVEYCEKMSDGGMLSKIYSITQAGKKHLCEELQRIELTNPYHIINDAKIALYCSSVLSVNELISFKENLLNYLELYKIKLEKGLKNEYISLNEIQKKTIEITLQEVNGIIKLL
ncbi:MAG: PadR family transcriptional regulator [Candidatus Gastranaerophilales bacterium]|nr:PadR family transcriptional regulator [Candidatus Gastranaerophilales bacterium]